MDKSPHQVGKLFDKEGSHDYDGSCYSSQEIEAAVQLQMEEGGEAPAAAAAANDTEAEAQDDMQLDQEDLDKMEQWRVAKECI